jgi:hypothetical protein
MLEQGPYWYSAGGARPPPTPSGANIQYRTRTAETQTLTIFHMFSSFIKGTLMRENKYFLV